MKPSPPHSPPFEPLSTAQLTGNAFLELIKRGSTEAILGTDRAQSRLNALLSKFHFVAGIRIPVPNIIAFNEIRALSTADTANWVAQALFILQNQDNPDILFLRGDDRNRAVHAACHKISAYAAARYFIAIREVLSAIEKKNTSSSQNLQAMAENLIKHAESSLSPSNSDGQPDTFSTK